MTDCSTSSFSNASAILRSSNICKTSYSVPRSALLRSNISKQGDCAWTAIKRFRWNLMASWSEIVRSNSAFKNARCAYSCLAKACPERSRTDRQRHPTPHFFGFLWLARRILRRQSNRGAITFIRCGCRVENCPPLPARGQNDSVLFCWL